MPHKGRDKSISFQHFPTGHLLLRISSVVSWELEEMEWTRYSVQPLEQKFPPPSKALYCIRFCTSGKKKAKLLNISCPLTVLVTSQEEHFTLADAVLGGDCAVGLLCTGWKMPQVPKGGTNLVIADLTCTVTQRLRAVTSATTSPPATRVRMRLLNLYVDLRCCCSTPDTWEVQNKK